MYNKGHANLKRLEENCLLESADHGNCVKMHDLVRDMALYITSQSPRYLVKAWNQLTELPTEHEWTDDLQKVSLMRNDISKFRLDMTLPKFTALSTLLLQYNSSLREIDDSVFTLMTELKVLDLSHCYSIRNLPNSISGLVKLTALLLNGCGNLEHVPSLAKLGVLKKLDLGYTRITAISDGLEMLVHLRYLDLYAYDIREMPGGILPKLFRLQYLRLDNAVAEAEEVSRLTRLDYSFLGGRRGKAVGIGGLTNFGDSIKIPTDIQRLVIQHCDDLRRIECFYYLSSYTSALQTLEDLVLQYLDNLIAILGEEIDGAKSTLPTPITPGIFSCLKTIRIWSCPKLKRLFPPKLLRNLQNLEEIRVWKCSGLVEIVEASSDKEEEDKEASKNSIKLSLPNLRSIVLRFLPELRSFCKSCYAIHCDSLRSIYIEGCPKLKTISPLFP
ncbi:disease resistance protein RPS2-like [Pistacia vera]|uniref:disease resistance protein RPS2-like n=1 Tax=Pistacia vera TaxID=55513 RepID=UPI001263BB97|nr:disease resistance protein RPS2-like [Pistacia vera]